MAKTFLLLVVLSTLATAERQPESHCRDLFAKAMKGETEVVLPDRTRADVVTDSHAIEIEFAAKWCEGFGQSLWYGFQLQKKAGLVLILEDEKDRRFLVRLRSLLVYRKLNDVAVWTIDEAGAIKKEFPKPQGENW